MKTGVNALVAASYHKWLQCCIGGGGRWCGRPVPHKQRDYYEHNHVGNGVDPRHSLQTTIELTLIETSVTVKTHMHHTLTSVATSTMTGDSTLASAIPNGFERDATRNSKVTQTSEFFQSEDRLELARARSLSPNHNSTKRVGHVLMIGDEMPLSACPTKADLSRPVACAAIETSCLGASRDRCQ